MKVQADIGVVDIAIHLLIWFVLSVITGGIALFFFPYSFAKFVINRSSLIDHNGVSRKMTCNTELFGNVGHVILWIVISLLTFGLGYVFYFYRVWNYSLNNTSIA